MTKMLEQYAQFLHSRAHQSRPGAPTLDDCPFHDSAAFRTRAPLAAVWVGMPDRRAS